MTRDESDSHTDEGGWLVRKVTMRVMTRDESDSHTDEGDDSWWKW